MLAKNDDSGVSVIIKSSTSKQSSGLLLVEFGSVLNRNVKLWKRGELEGDLGVLNVFGGEGWRKIERVNTGGTKNLLEMCCLSVFTLLEFNVRLPVTGGLIGNV